MKQLRSISTLFLIALISLGTSSAAAAQPIHTPAGAASPNAATQLRPARTLSASQELTVTAVVPAHRDIVVSASGEILEITSNTPEDVTPQVYLGSVAPENQQELTPDLLRQYRLLVPEGTAAYGTLYEAPMPARLGLATTRPIWQ